MELSVEGYKSIASKQKLKFNGLTVLAGANSSGKSSFMQPFLILKQTIENHYDSGSLALYGENAKLTDASQLISKVPGYDKKSFSIEMISSESSCYVSYKYKKSYGLRVESVTITDDDPGLGLTLKIGMKSEDIEKSIKDDDFQFFKELYDDKNIEYRWKAVRQKCFIKAVLLFKQKKFNPFRPRIDPTRNLKTFITRLIHVPGLRGNPERSYKIAASEDVYPGSFEKYVASILSDWTRLKKFTSKHELLISQLKDLGLASNINVTKVDDTSVSIQVSRTNANDTYNDCVDIADVGFGVSQTIPVLVALIGAKKGQFVYIEQPELHLHPKAQFKLAQIIVSAINRGVRVIIETHSSILIRGIQIAVVKKELDYNKVSLNWFTQNVDTGETQVDQAGLDEMGAFGAWPEDFDDTNLDVDQMYLDAVEELIYE